MWFFTFSGISSASANGIFTPIEDFIDWMIQSFIELFDQIVQTSTSVFNNVKEECTDTTELVKMEADKLWGDLKENATETYDFVEEGYSNINGDGVIDILNIDISDTWSNIKGDAKKYWDDAIVIYFDAYAEALRIAEKSLENILNLFDDDFWDDMLDLLNDGVSIVVSLIEDGVDEVVDLGTDLFDIVGGWLGGGNSGRGVYDHAFTGYASTSEIYVKVGEQIFISSNRITQSSGYFYFQKLDNNDNPTDKIVKVVENSITPITVDTYGLTVQLYIPETKDYNGNYEMTDGKYRVTNNSYGDYRFNEATINVYSDNVTHEEIFQPKLNANGQRIYDDGSVSDRIVFGNYDSNGMYDNSFTSCATKSSYNAHSKEQIVVSAYKMMNINGTDETKDHFRQLVFYYRTLDRTKTYPVDLLGYDQNMLTAILKPPSSSNIPIDLYEIMFDGAIDNYDDQPMVIAMINIYKL